jgi:hypothetical protein
MTKNWNRAVAKYNLEAANFSNADGNFVGQVKNNYIGESRADGMGGDMYSQLPDSDKYYTVVCSNTSTSATVTAVVFGGSLYSGATQPNAGATVIVDESSHAQVRSQSIAAPFWVNGLRYLTTTANQLNGQVLTIARQSPSGDFSSKIFRPVSFKTASQNQTLQIDAPGYKFGVDGNTYINVPLLPSEQVTIVMQIGGRFDPNAIISGDSALQVANQQQLSSGLVQIVR